VHGDALQEPDATIDLNTWSMKIIDKKMDMSGLKQLEDSEFSGKTMIELLEKRNHPSEHERNDAYKLLVEQFTTIQNSEENSISDSDKKEQYTNIAAPGVKDFIRRCFRNELNQNCVTGIATTNVVLKSCYDSSEFIEALEYVRSQASKLPVAMDISAALQLEADVPVSAVEPSYETSLLEPPTFPTKRKFSPPLYDTSRNWISYIELRAIPYFLTHSLSFSERACALWHCLPTVNHRNRYMRIFGSYLTANIIKTRGDFENLYRKVGETFWPEQTRLPQDFEKMLNNPNFTRQKFEENYEDLVSRLKRTFRQAYPNAHDSDTNKLKLCELVFKGIRDRWLKELLFKEHYDIVFETGEINKMLEIMNKEHIKYHKAKKLAMEGLTLNYINTDPREKLFGKDFSGSSKSKREDFGKKSFSKPLNSRNSNHLSGDKLSRRDAAIKKEVDFLIRSRSKNYRNRDGKREYLNAKEFAEVRKMAEHNVQKRFEEQHKKAANTRKYKRKVENKQRRTNVLIEPRRKDWN